MNLLIFGDSITWGASDKENGGWANMLKNFFANGEVDVYNCGVSGDNTNDLLARFSSEAKARISEEETVVIFAIGINDSQYTGTRENTRVCKDKFVNNLEVLIEQAGGLPAKVLFVGLNHVEEEKMISHSSNDRSYDNANIDLYNTLIGDVCKKHNVPFLQIENLLEFTDLHDGLHPNTGGHQKMFSAVLEFLRTEGIFVD